MKPRGSSWIACLLVLLFGPAASLWTWAQPVETPVPVGEAVEGVASTADATAGENLNALQSAVSEAQRLAQELSAISTEARAQTQALSTSAQTQAATVTRIEDLLNRVRATESALQAQVAALESLQAEARQPSTTQSPTAPAAKGPSPALIAAAVLAALAAVAALATLFIAVRHSKVTRHAVSDVPDRLAHRLDPEKWAKPLRDAVERLEYAVQNRLDTADPSPVATHAAESAADFSSECSRLHARFDALETHLHELVQSHAVTAPPHPQPDVQAAHRAAPGPALAAATAGTRAPSRAPFSGTETEADPQPVATVAPSEETDALHAAKLPAAFSPTGRLSSWRKEIAGHVHEELPAANGLVEGLEQWREANNAREETRLVDATHELGKRFFSYLEATRGSEPNDWIDAIQEWTKSFRIGLEEAFPHCRLVAVYPQDRFDTDRMEVARGSASGRLSVKKPRSWMIVEKTEHGERVLRRAEVLTA
ncbi:MAG: hypothetical protein ACFBZ8_12210 [Opitutales bacterium]